MAETSGQRKEAGVLPPGSLTAGLSNALKSFSTLREKALELAVSLGVPYEGQPEGLSSPVGLRHLLEKTLLAEERMAEMAGLQEPVATNELASAVAAQGGTLDIPADPAPPIAQDLPSEVEEFLEKIIEDVSKTKEAQQSFSNRTTDKAAPLAPVPQKQKIPVPEDSRPGTKQPTAQQAKPSTPEAIVPEPRGQQNLAGKDRMAKADTEEQLWLKSVDFAERTLGPEHPETADLLGSLAVMYHKRRNYADAETLHRRALLIREKTMGTEHPAVATSLNNLALLYKDQGKYAEAQKMLERSLAIIEKLFGPVHPKTARRIANLADLLFVQGENGRAEQLYQRALAILENEPAGERTNVRTSLMNYLALLREGNRKAEAAKMETRIAAILSPKADKL